MAQRAAILNDPAPAAWAACATLIIGCALDAFAYVYVKHTSDVAVMIPPPPFALIHLLVRLATLATFVMWVDRVYANLAGLDHECEYNRIWAALGFVLPPFNFFRPPQIILETARESRAPWWVAPITLTWWIMLFVPPSIVMGMVGSDPATRNAHARTAHAINAADALLAIVMVVAITAAQRIEQRRRAFVEAAERRARLATATRMKAMALATGDTEALAAAEEVLPPPPKPAAVTVFERAIVAPRPVIAPRPPSRPPIVSVAVQELSGVPAATWKTFGASVMAVIGVLTLGAGTILVTGRMYTVMPIGGIIYLLAGTILVGMWALLRREVLRGDASEASRWRLIAGFGAGIALLNLLVLAGVLGE